MLNKISPCSNSNELSKAIVTLNNCSNTKITKLIYNNDQKLKHQDSFIISIYHKQFLASQLVSFYEKCKISTKDL